MLKRNITAYSKIIAAFIIWIWHYLLISESSALCSTKLLTSETPETCLITISLILDINWWFFQLPFNLGAFKKCGQGNSGILKAASEST